MSISSDAFPTSELIINPDGSIYHLKLKPEDIANTILMVGDPERVTTISRHFERLELTKSNREFVTHTGWHKGKRVSVVSTGIGTDNVEIALTELDALMNINFKTRMVKPETTSLKIIRIGTTGSIQSEIVVGSHIASVSAIGLDTLMNFYHLHQTQEETRTSIRLKETLNLNFIPYQVSCSESLLMHFAYDMIKGHTMTCPGFYAPQGRHLRIPIMNEKYLSILTALDSPRMTNMEMETSGYYAFGRMMGHQVLSVSVVLANRISNQVALFPEKMVEELIKIVLERI